MISPTDNRGVVVFKTLAPNKSHKISCQVMSVKNVLVGGTKGRDGESNSRKMAAPKKSFHTAYPTKVVVVYNPFNT